MIDQSFTNPAAILHLPDVHLTGIHTKLMRGQAGTSHRIDDPKRALLIYALRGDFWLEDTESGAERLLIRQGTAVGFQVGRPHRWIAVHDDFELFFSSIDRRAALLQGLDRETIIVPPDAHPQADIIRYAVAIHLTEYQTLAAGDDDMIIRRCAEIIMAQLIRHARTVVVDGGDVPTGIAHDEYLLRAWSAYFAAPRRRWTVKALADAAGLGRTAFSERFRKAVGVPPLTALTDLRLDHAMTLLKGEKVPLIEIAFTVGYNSEAAFVRAFHRKYGLPPGRFRQEQAFIAMAD